MLASQMLAGLLGARLEGFEPPTRGLGKRGGRLHRIAEYCESRIPKRFSPPVLAGVCTVLRSRWCQSGVSWYQLFGVLALSYGPLYCFSRFRCDSSSLLCTCL